MEKPEFEQSVIKDVLLAGIKEQRANRRWKIIFRIIWLVIFITIFYYTFIKSDHNNVTKEAVAVVNLKGMISTQEQTYQTVTQGVEDALKDKNILAVIIRANSGGGSVTASEMIYNEILRLKKKYPNKHIDLVTEEMCASGCYYIAAATDKIYAASHASIVGSIGVIYPGFGVTNLMQKLGVDSRLLIAGKNKAMGYPFIPANKQQMQLMQDMLNKLHEQFINVVKLARKDQLKLNDPDLFSGRYWIASDAVKLGLIDGFYTVDSLARDIYHTDNIIDYTPTPEPLERIAKKFGAEVYNTINESIHTITFN